MAWITFNGLVLLSTVYLVAGATCPGNSTSTGCYVIRQTPSDWNAARSDCQTLATSLGRPNFGYLTSLADKPQNDYVIQLMGDLIDAQTSFAAKDALRSMWVGGYEESAARGDSPLPLWRWLKADTKPFQFQGCFKDDANQREMTVHKTFTDLSPQKCIDYCYTLGYKVAATRQGDTCSCGETYGAYGTGDNCLTYCTGSYDLCGGLNMNHIYLINGSYVDWTSNQPNNYAGYQPCGHVERYTGETKYTLGDKLCRQQLSYLCSVPQTNCDNRVAWSYSAGSQCVHFEIYQKKNWFEARLACREKGGDLVSADSETIMAELSSTLVSTLRYSDPLWVGAVGRKWMWDDGKEFLFTSWPNSHPISADYNCLQMFSDQQKVFSWRDVDCSTSLPYICYIDMITPLPTTTTTTTTTTPRPTTKQPSTANGGTTKKGTTGQGGITNGGTGGSSGNPTPSKTTGNTGSQATGTKSTTPVMTSTAAPNNSSDPDAGASIGGPGLGQTTYILIGVIGAVIVLVVIASIIFINYKKKTKETASLVHPDKEHNVYQSPPYLPNSDRDTQPHRGADESSTVTTSNIRTQVSDVPEFSNIKTRVHESRFKLDPINKGEVRMSKDDDQKRREKKERKRREKEERGEGTMEKKHRKKKKSHKDNKTTLPTGGENVVVDIGIGEHLY